MSAAPPSKRRKRADVHSTPSPASMEAKATKESIVKRRATHPRSRPTDLYITRSTPFRAYQDRALKLLAIETVQEVELHGLGAQVGRCCELAVSIQKHSRHPVKLLVTTGTVGLTDDIPVADELAEDAGQQERLTGAVHIRVQKS
eukprot:GGOE01060733.1.p2 GENE.GGOE01060733.1~~GGOE01060733.1.p2  ORF type:complete len:145 (-),score=29.64 GGOE01060733.1:206-640(-)